MITFNETVSVLEKIVEEKGRDYMYPRGALGFSMNERQDCVYENTQTGGPACIVGYVLNHFDLLEHATEGTAAGALDVVKENFDQDSCYLLDIAQGSQDSGTTWGEALDTAKERVGASHIPHKSLGMDEFDA